MASVVRLRSEIAGESEELQAWQAPFSQGYSSYILGVEAGSDTAVGCAQLCRLAVGGYLVLRQHFFISRVLVLEDWRRQGLGSALLDELLRRIPSVGTEGRADSIYWAWTLCDKDDQAAVQFLEAAGGEACGDVGQTLRQYPLVGSALLVSGGALLRLDALVFRFRGRGDVPEYNSSGRLAVGACVSRG